MSELNIPIIPTNFTVWFAYVLGRSPALRKTIDILRSNQRTFDKSVSRELYSTFLRSNSLVNTDQSISEELGTILRNVREDISEAIGTNSTHAAGLREVEASLDPQPTIDLPGAGLPRVGGQIAGQCRRMRPYLIVSEGLMKFAITTLAVLLFGITSISAAPSKSSKKKAASQTTESTSPKKCTHPDRPCY